MNSSTDSDFDGVPKEFPATPANPTAFDYRNVGTIVEVEPQLDADEKTITVNLAPEIVSHHGDTYMGAPEAPHELLAAVKQPAFHVMKVADSENEYWRLRARLHSETKRSEEGRG